MHSSVTAAASRPRTGARRLALPAVVLLVGCALSAWSFALLRAEAGRRQEEFFTERVTEAQAAIRVRMTTYEDALRGGVSYFGASQNVERDEWRSYTESLQLRKRYPGINGLGVILAVTPETFRAWRERVRPPGAPEPTVKPFPGTPEQPGAPWYLISFLEGNTAEGPPIGRNIATEPSRREAAESARDSGELRVNHRLLGSRDLQRRAGLLLYLPLYAKGANPATLEARRKAHVGWVYAQVFPDVFLQGVLGPMGETLRLNFYEAGGWEPQRLLYASAADAGRPAPQFERTTEMEMAGQRFQLGWRRGQKFPPTQLAPARWAAAGGVVATLLLAGLVLSLQSTGERAHAIAAERTAELEKSRKMFQRLFESAPDAVILVARDGRIVRTNARADALFGWAAGELAGRPVAELLPERLRAPQAAFENYFQRPAPAAAPGALEFVGRRRDGGEFAGEIRLNPVETDDGVQTLAVVSDVTERKRLEESVAQARDAALQASRMKSEFLANMSHEIRTPMNAVVGMAGLLADTPLSLEQEEMVRAIQGGAESLLAIINDILDLSKIEAGKLRLEPVEFDFGRMIEETVTLLGPRAREKGLALGCEIDPALRSQVLGDAGRTRQVFTNLLGNAIKFTERGHIAVRVRVARATDDRLTLRVTVRDTGVGIAPEARQRLFQPFTQEDSSPTRRFGGTGLGLAISRQLVKLMGGEIGVESELGAGSTFWFELGFARLAAPAAIATVAAPRLPAGRRALVVRRDDAPRGETLAQLARLGVAAESADSGTAALERLRTATGPWHVALLEWELADTGGVELGAAIRAQARGRDVPLVMFSAPGAKEDTAALTAIGGSAILPSPVSDAALYRCLARLFAEATITRPDEPPVPPAGPARRILVVEDNPANQRVTTLLLTKLGHMVDVAADGRRGLEMLAAKRYDAVLMDCQMPVMDGFEATRRIRAGLVRGVDRHIPVIALTAYAMASDRTKCLETGMNDHLSKPIRVAELCAALHRCVSGSASATGASAHGATPSGAAVA